MADPRSAATDRWQEFFRTHLRNEIERVVDGYPEERSVTVEVLELFRFDRALSETLFDDPDASLLAAERAVRNLHPDLGRVTVRITNPPSHLSPVDIRSKHVGELVGIEGMVVAVEPRRVRLRIATYRCGTCGETFDRHPTGLDLPAPQSCDQCTANGPFQLQRDHCSVMDSQPIQLVDAENRQKTDSNRPIEVLLDDDLVGTAARDDRLRATGVVRLRRTADMNRFRPYIDATDAWTEGDGGGMDSSAGSQPRGPVLNDVKDLIESRWHSTDDR